VGWTTWFHKTHLNTNAALVHQDTRIVLQARYCRLISVPFQFPPLSFIFSSPIHPKEVKRPTAGWIRKISYPRPISVCVFKRPRLSVAASTLHCKFTTYQLRDRNRDVFHFLNLSLLNSLESPSLPGIGSEPSVKPQGPPFFGLQLRSPVRPVPSQNQAGIRTPSQSTYSNLPYTV